MKRNKWTILLGVVLLALVSCIREEAPRERAPQSVEGKKVKVEFSIAGAAADPSTKGLDNGGDIARMYVAVFGSSGFLKEYAEAQYTDAAFEERRQAYDYARPFTKESLLYREIFEKYYPGQAEMVTGFWMPNRSWEGCDVNDPSARVLSNYGDSGK